MAIITHYTTLQVFLNHILEDSSFRLNSLASTNDPFEYTKRTPSVGARVDHDQRFIDVLKIIDDFYPYKVKVGCFVADDGDEQNYHTWTSIRNAPLWAHYGANNQGVAVVFDSERFVNACRNHVKYPWAICAERVEYLESLQYLHSPYSVNLDDIVDTEDLTIYKHLFDMGRTHWFKKGQQWTHENEFRVMLFNEDAGSTIIDIRDSLKAVVFGEQVSRIVQNTVGKYCHEQGIRVLALGYDEMRNCYVAEDIFPK